MARISAYVVSRTIIVIVGVLIAAGLVIGVIFLLHNRGEQVRRDQASQIADQQIKDEQKADEQANEPAETGTGTTEETPAPTTVATTATELPTTGAQDVLMPIVVLALLTFAATSFVVSRQRVKAL